ncbi:MAG: antibiotic biosynthesis monooxygenase [Moraxella sp.]|nr:antibiotic biosynthesis monooxygenase [Moraxella sp.]
MVLKGFILISVKDRQQILSALAEHIELTKAEAGCLKFDITPDDHCQDKYWVYEEFVNKAAFEYHQARVRSSHWGRVSADVERHYEALLELV